jgi:hypothetical protein
MSTCKISKDIVYNCEKPPIAGQKDEVIVIPKRIITGATINTANHLIIEAIAKQTMTRGFVFTGTSMLLKSDKGYVPSEFGHGYRHRVPFRIHGNTPDIKQQLEYLINEVDGVVVVMKNNYKGNAGNAKWEVFGWDVGLRVTLLEDTEGKMSYAIELASSEDSPEPHLPRNIFLTSEVVTDAIVAGLTVATSP